VPTPPAKGEEIEVDGTDLGTQVSKGSIVNNPKGDLLKEMEIADRLANSGYGWAKAGLLDDGVGGVFSYDTKGVTINVMGTFEGVAYHEFGHAYVDFMKETTPKLYDDFVRLVEDSPYMTDPRVIENARLSGRSDSLVEEALAYAIQDRGLLFETEGKFQRFISYLKRMWTQMKHFLGINTSFDEWVNMAVVDLNTVNKAEAVRIAGVVNPRSPIKFAGSNEERLALMAQGDTVITPAIQNDGYLKDIGLNPGKVRKERTAEEKALDDAIKKIWPGSAGDEIKKVVHTWVELA